MYSDWGRAGVSVHFLRGRDYWMIEAFADMKRESEKEWYYGNKDKERLGPYSYEEVCGFFLESYK